MLVWGSRIILLLFLERWVCTKSDPEGLWYPSPPCLLLEKVLYLQSLKHSVSPMSLFPVRHFLYTPDYIVKYL